MRVKENPPYARGDDSNFGNAVVAGTSEQQVVKRFIKV
jgi:hypothetical protein